jgi:hypothetical protein
MDRRTFLSSAALLACAMAVRPAAAEEKPALAGSWQKSGGEMRLDFADKDTLKISPHNKDELILLVCKYTVDKDGVVKVKISELRGTAKDMVQAQFPAGAEFSFKWQAKGDSAELDDLKGKDVDGLKSHLEGKYEKK